MYIHTKEDYGQVPRGSQEQGDAIKTFGRIDMKLLGIWYLFVSLSFLRSGWAQWWMCPWRMAFGQCCHWSFSAWLVSLSQLVSAVATM